VPVDLSRHLGEIERATVSHRRRAAVRGPADRHLPTARSNAHAIRTCARCIAPLATMAEQHGTSVWPACTSPRPPWTPCWRRRQHRVRGAARSVLVFRRRPPTSQAYRGPARVLAHRKCKRPGPSLGRWPAPSESGYGDGWEGETIITPRSPSPVTAMWTPTSWCAQLRPPPQTGDRPRRDPLRLARRATGPRPGRSWTTWRARASASAAPRRHVPPGIERRREAMGGPVQWRLSQDTRGTTGLIHRKPARKFRCPRASGSQLVIRDDDSEETP
jgi:hypothetical protein